MKTTLLVLSIIAVSLYATVQHLHNRGSERVLKAIQAVRHGTGKEEVRALMGRDPNVYPAGPLPGWMKEVVPEKETGEYWLFFMGYPARILIIYFGDDGKAVFSTWAYT